MRRYYSLLLLLVIPLSVFSDVTIKIASGARGIIMSVASTDSKIVGSITTVSSSGLSVKLAGVKNAETFNSKLPKYIASGGLEVKNSSEGVLVTIGSPEFNKDGVILKNKDGKLFLLLSKEPSTEFVTDFVINSIAEDISSNIATEPKVDKNVVDHRDRIISTKPINNEIENNEVIQDTESIDEELSEPIDINVLVDNVTLDNIALFNRDGMEYIYFYGKNIVVDSVLNTTSSSTVFFAEDNFKNNIGDKELDGCFLSKSIKFKKNKCTINVDKDGNFVYISNISKDVVLLLFSDNREKEGEIISAFNGVKLFSATLYSKTLENTVESELPTDSIILIKDNVNIRSTPKTSTRDNIIGSFKINQTFSLLSKEGDWYKINVDGKDGWIFNSLCKLVESVGSSTTRDELNTNDIAIPNNKVMYLIKDNVNFRSTPVSGSNDNIIGKYPLGTRLELIKKSNSWCFVAVDNKKAWVFGKLIEDSSLITNDQWDAIYNSQSTDNELPIVDEFKSESDMPEIGNSVADGGFALSKDSTVPEIALVTKDTVKTPVKIVKKKIKRYRKFGRDPFLPLDKSDFITPDLPELENLNIVGIVYSETDAVALFEDLSSSGGALNSINLRVGDHIKNGKVLQVNEDKVRFLIFESDFSYTVDKKLKDKKEK